MHGQILIALVFFFAVFMLAWNFYEPFRVWMRMRFKSTTVVEGAIGTGIMYYGEITNGLQEAQTQGLVPAGVEGWLPSIIFIWIMLKRFQTHLRHDKGTE